VTETLRLVLLANTLLNEEPWKMEILDFGCGMGTFVQTAREKLNMKVWGHDIIEPKFGKEFFLRILPENKFDMIVSCEVLEHLPFPYEILQVVFRSLKPGGVFAFQTAYYDPAACGRDWWYVGPANGHVSLYSVGALDALFRKFGGTRKLLWNNYPGIQAWQLSPPESHSGDAQGGQKISSPKQRHLCSRNASLDTSAKESSLRMTLSAVTPQWAKRIYRRARRILSS
jgi:SAM-dependent methyltransferase